MLQRLKFLHKLALMPAVAALGFLVVLLVLATLGTRNRKLLDDIEDGYFPAYAASDAIEETLIEIQRGLQDAVGAADATMFNETDGLRDRFLATLAEVAKNPTIEQARLRRIETGFGRYYELARSTSQRMIAGET
ncbi:MAG TPA: hypothetical protein VE078_17220, partial [Thermoanaerobaculia bacterium]|nr:hypothetical protein [Thermoanaerobaculia bacterium]